MMPGVGFEEMILLVVVAIIVIGPKDLPLMMRKFGRFTGKMRAMAFEFKQGIDELGRQAELDELRKEVANLKASTGLEDLKREIEEDRAAIEKDVNEVMAPIPAPVHPALRAVAAVPAIAEVKPEPAPYAGLSPDHPGYDTGEDNRIGGAPVDMATIEAAPADTANGVHVNGEASRSVAGEPYIIHEDVAPAELEPVKQGTTV
ncbi:MAG: Sec-independent protein translocase protein TatB [Hyphomonadaceae bacterium]|nr:Sec-independent protein translocase protein TatB [Hyphomonadaceae bacterium]